MKRFTKAMAAILLMATLLYVVGCTPDELETVVGKGSVYGMVTDYATGEPVGNANVQLRPSGETTLTGSDGMYEFPEVLAGEYSITVSKAEYTDLVDEYVIEVLSGKKVRRDVQIKKRPATMHIYDNESQEISELDFGSDVGVSQKSFGIFNGGTQTINYVISKTVNWITGISQPSGTIKVGMTCPIVITIDRALLENGDNSTTLLITAPEGGSKELTVKVKKDGGMPMVTISEAIEIDNTTFRIKCEVVSGGGQEVTERGICWNTFGDPTLDDETIKYPSGGLGQYTIRMENLTLSTRYYVCAYAKNALGIGYSRVLEFMPGAIGTPPSVTTDEVSGVTTTAATCSGNVIDDGGVALIERGVCWGEKVNPDLNGSHRTANEATTGTFSVSISGLTPNKTYHVRCYATNSKGTSYGADLVFATTEGLPTVTTSSVSSITGTSAKGGGNVVSEGTSTVTERGICWGTGHNPTISGAHISSGSGLGSYKANMTGLTPNTTYYVRAYATNNSGTDYGEEECFTTTQSTNPSGLLSGIFSVSATKQVWFSQGNLQYIGSASTPYWKFAENQWDYLGTSTGQNSSNQNVDRDLFGWGTSGWYSGSQYYMPFDVDNSYPYSQYGPPSDHDLTEEYANADWGVYNTISNGGNTANTWRTMTLAEWGYVLFTRNTPSRIRFAKAVVNDVNGVILLPDDWDGSNYSLAAINNKEASFSSNVISDSSWISIFESRGAVFLPSAGTRAGSSVMYAAVNGYYWTTTSYNSYQACYLFLGDSKIDIGSPSMRYYGRSVRLVRDVE